MARTLEDFRDLGFGFYSRHEDGVIHSRCGEWIPNIARRLGSATTTIAA